MPPSACSTTNAGATNPEIAARVSLTYNSSIDHDFNMKESGGPLPMNPGSINMQPQIQVLVQPQIQISAQPKGDASPQTNADATVNTNTTPTITNTTTESIVARPYTPPQHYSPPQVYAPPPQVITRVVPAPQAYKPYKQLKPLPRRKGLMITVSHPVMESIYHQYYEEPRYRPSVITAQRLAGGLRTGQFLHPLLLRQQFFDAAQRLLAIGQHVHVHAARPGLDQRSGERTAGEQEGLHMNAALRAAQDAQHVVLRAGHAVLLAEGGFRGQLIAR